MSFSYLSHLRKDICLFRSEFNPPSRRVAGNGASQRRVCRSWEFQTSHSVGIADRHPPVKDKDDGDGEEEHKPEPEE